MFRRVFLASLAVLSFAITAPFTAQAQSLYVSAGLAIPSGDDLEDFSTGWSAAGGVTFDVGEAGLWAGIDGSYGKNSLDDDVLDESIKPWSLMGILGYSVPTEGSVSPYFWAGAGLVGASVSDSDFEIDSGFGWQAGAGLGFGSGNARPYVEGRYTSASLDASAEGLTESADFRMLAVHVGVAIGIGN